MFIDHIVWGHRNNISHLFVYFVVDFWMMIMAILWLFCLEIFNSENLRFTIYFQIVCLLLVFFKNLLNSLGIKFLFPWLFFSWVFFPIIWGVNSQIEFYFEILYSSTMSRIITYIVFFQAHPRLHGRVMYWVTLVLFVIVQFYLEHKYLFKANSVLCI